MVMGEGEQQVDQRHQRTAGDAQDGAGGGQFFGLLHQQGGQGQTQQQLDGRFHDLGFGGGGHVSVALKVAPEGGHTAYEQGGEGQSPHRGGSACTADDRCNKFSPKEHDEGGQSTQGKEGAQSDLEHPVHLVVAA